MRRTQRIHGYEITAHHHGPLDAPTLVLVHGMMEPANVWLPVVERLKARHHCVVLDMPWNGAQGGLWGQDLRSEAWLATALSAFDLKPDAWVAHSFGATTLLSLLAADADARITPGVRAPAVLISPFFKASHEEVSWALFERYVTRFTDFVEMSIRARGRRQFDPAVLRRMTHKARDAFGCYVWMQFWQLFARTPFLQLARVTQPVLTLVGGDDDSSPPADARALTAALPDGVIQTFEGCGHFLLGCGGVAVVDAIDDFLAHACPHASPMQALPAYSVA